MAENKTKPSDADVTQFLARIENKLRRDDAHTLNQLFQTLTGWSPVLWGDRIIGYGRYDYVYKTGRSGSFLATGFAPRKANLSLYIMPGYQDMTELLDKLGKHKKGAACLYINKLADVDEEVLARIILSGLDHLKKHQYRIIA